MLQALRNSMLITTPLLLIIVTMKDRKFLLRTIVILPSRDLVSEYLISNLLLALPETVNYLKGTKTELLSKQARAYKLCAFLISTNL